MKRELKIVEKFINDNLINRTNNQEVILKKIYIGEPIGVYTFETPCVIITPNTSNSIRTQYVGEDTHQENLIIRFYVNASKPLGMTTDDPSVATYELIDLCETFIYYVRQEPTFNSRFVTTDIGNVNYKLEQAGDNNIYRIAEIQFNILSRSLWNKPSLTDNNET